MPDDNEKYAHISSNHYHRNTHSGSANGRLLDGFLGYQRSGTVDCGSDKLLKTCSSKDTANAICTSRFYRPNSIHGVCMGSASVGALSLWDARDLVERSVADSSSERRGFFIVLEEDVLPFKLTME